MKLYDVPRNTVVRIIDPDVKVPPLARQLADQQLINFHKIDGIYSFCHDQQGNVVHLAAWTEVEPIGPIHDPR